MTSDGMPKHAKLRMLHRTSGKPRYHHFACEPISPFPEPPRILRMMHFASGKDGYGPYISSPHVCGKTGYQLGSKDDSPLSNTDTTQRALHVASGKAGFNPTLNKTEASTKPIKKPLQHVELERMQLRSSGSQFISERELVIQMLKMEQRLRMSRETQIKYDSQKLDGVDLPPFSIEDAIQRHVLQEHGVKPTAANLAQYRCINGLYQNDREV